ncbi:MAG: alpha/beta fold hydrolase [Anaerolineae bacterium]|nr:alpha/beta fold hydrolase [Anaerolineae bacterium]
MPSVNLPDGTLYYAEKRGAGADQPPLALVHGAGGSHVDWAPELRRLRGARVIALDLPGHGKSSAPGRDSIPAYARDVIALLDALAIPRAVIAGHSMGGAVAQQVALDWPDRVAGLVLLGTGSKLPVDPALPDRIVNEPEAALDWLVEWAWHPSASDEMRALGRALFSATPREVVRDDYRACQAFDVRARLEQIAAPALVVGAEDDRMVPLKFSRTLAERIPGARLVVIEGAGHMFPLEKAPQVASAIEGWLAEQR